MIVREQLRLVVKHPRLTSEDIRIKGVVIPFLLQTANEVEDSENYPSNTQDTGSDSANNGSSRHVRARVSGISTGTRGGRARRERSD